MRRMRRSSIVALLLPVVVCCAGGCGLPNLLVFPWAERDATKDVKEAHHLTAERLLILPYLGRAVEFESPTAGTDISNAIIQHIRKELRGRVHAVVNPQQVAKYQQSKLDWQGTAVAEIGREFQVDKVLYLEIQRYSIMEERSANLYRGRLSGHLQVIDPNAPSGKEILYEADVSVQVPDDKPIGASDIPEGKLRGATLYRFGQEVVWKFCDHQEPRLGGTP